MVKCYKCGKEFSSFHACLKKDNPKYFAEDFEKAERGGMSAIVIDSGVLTENGIVRHMKMHNEAAEKYGYSLTNTVKTGSGLSYRLILTYEKKEIVATKFINCSYCKTRYDANQYFKCPNCGGIPTN